MAQIVLIRPGSTDYHQQKRILGTLDVPLNAEGTDEVAQLIEELRPLRLETVYSSDCRPALETAEAISRAIDIKLRKLDGLRNLDYGLWQGMQIDEVRLRQPKVYRQWQESPELVCPPEGEMLGQAENRVRNCMMRLLKRHKEGAVGLVVSEPLATLVRRFFDQGELGNLWKATLQHGQWEILEVSPAVLTPSR